MARRVVLLTDGNETRGSAIEAIRALVDAKVEVALWPLRYARRNEVFVEKVVAPPRARAGQPVSVRAVVVSTEDDVPATVRFTDEEGRGLASSDVRLRKGRNVFEIRKEFESQRLAGTHPYRSADQDRWILTAYPRRWRFSRSASF